MIDKDFAAALIGRLVDATSLLLLTGVEQVLLDFGTPRQRAVDTLTLDEARAHMADGQFPAGSMGPKVEAAIQFVEAGGRDAVITSLDARRRRPGRRRRHPDRRLMARRSVLTWRPPRGDAMPPVSARARALLEDPQGFGNYMTYRDAYRILGWDPAEIYRDGAIALDRSEWADLGWMANHLGPSPLALMAMRAAVDEEHVGPYSPDLDERLRDLMAEQLLGRRARRRLRGDRHRGRPGGGRATRPWPASIPATRRS